VSQLQPYTHSYRHPQRLAKTSGMSLLGCSLWNCMPQVASMVALGAILQAEPWSLITDNPSPYMAHLKSCRLTILPKITCLILIVEQCHKHLAGALADCKCRVLLILLRKFWYWEVLFDQPLRRRPSVSSCLSLCPRLNRISIEFACDF
jgi:hypothetical protein